MLLANFFECVSTLCFQAKFGLLHLEIYDSVCSILLLSESISVHIQLEFTICNTSRLNLSEDSIKLLVVRCYSSTPLWHLPLYQLHQ